MSALPPYLTQEVLGAWRNGTRIRKVKAEPGDVHPIGTHGTVVGSLNHPELGLGYIVAWDGEAGGVRTVLGLVVGWKIMALA